MSDQPLTADELAAIRAEHADHGEGVWCGATPSVVDEQDPDPDHCLPYRLAREVERLQALLAPKDPEPWRCTATNEQGRRCMRSDVPHRGPHAFLRPKAVPGRQEKR